MTANRFNVRGIVAAIGLAGLLLAGCSGVRVQSADQAKAAVYAGIQESARQACYRLNNTSERTACLARHRETYRDYQERREQAGKAIEPAQ